MSRWGKISWLLCGLSIVILLGARFFLGGWINLLWIPLGIFLVSFFVALVVDFRFYLEFLTLRTTKHGMNMGAMILLVLAILVSLNFIAVRHNKTWDFTEEGLFTLAPQSKDLLKNLKDDMHVRIFYRGDKDKELKQKMMGSFELFQEASSKVKVEFINAYVNNQMAQEYLKGTRDNEQVVIFVEYKGRRERVEQPYEEEKITAAMIRATREKQTSVYFLTGHGERDIDSEEDTGLSTFKKSLTDSNYKVAKLNLMETPEIPADAGIIAIVGPQSQIFETEFEKLRAFARKGGKFFIAADPGMKHQISLLTRTFGVEFKNNYVINDAIQLTGRGSAGALGMVYDRGSDITKSFRSGDQFTLFDLASEVTKAADSPTGLSYTELVKTVPNSFALNEISKNAKPSDRRFYTLALAVNGKLGGEAGADGKVEDKSGDDEFSAVIFGDSDFVTQKDIIQGMNIDLAMNSISYLAKESDLISIRPKQPAGTKMSMTSVVRDLVVLAGLMIPLLFVSTSGVVWYRRRSA